MDKVEEEKAERPAEALPARRQIRGAVADALGAIARDGSADQLRGYANEAIGGTKLNIGLAVGSPELIVLGIAQRTVGRAQRYIGEAKLAAELEDGEDSDLPFVDGQDETEGRAAG
jgi:uncharacterized protein YjbJ (UPF0337 family)